MCELVCAHLCAFYILYVFGKSRKGAQQTKPERGKERERKTQNETWALPFTSRHQYIPFVSFFRCAQSSARLYAGYRARRTNDRKKAAAATLVEARTRACAGTAHRCENCFNTDNDVLAYVCCILPLPFDWIEFIFGTWWLRRIAIFCLPNCTLRIARIQFARCSGRIACDLWPEPQVCRITTHRDPFMCGVMRMKCQQIKQNVEWAWTPTELFGNKCIERTCGPVCCMKMRKCTFEWPRTIWPTSLDWAHQRCIIYRNSCLSKSKTTEVLSQICTSIKTRNRTTTQKYIQIKCDNPFVGIRNQIYIFADFGYFRSQIKDREKSHANLTFEVPNNI